MKPTRPKKVETVYVDAEDLEERWDRAVEILAEGVLAHLKKLGLLGPMPQEKTKRLEETREEATGESGKGSGEDLDNG